MNHDIATHKTRAEHDAATARLRLARSLEEMLEQLSRFGQPRVSLLSRGWHAHITMHTSAAGAQFEVQSDFGHRTPAAAVDQLRNRVRDILNQEEPQS